MINANLAASLPMSTERDVLNYLIKGYRESRRFEVSKLSEEAQTELRVLGYKVVFNLQKNMYNISW